MFYLRNKGRGETESPSVAETRFTPRPTTSTPREFQAGGDARPSSCCSAATSHTPASQRRPARWPVSRACGAVRAGRSADEESPAARRWRSGCRIGTTVHLAVDRQSRLALSLRPRHRRDAERLRPHGHAADAPELLDWLAAWFLEHGGSLKQLHRLIVTSNTYRQSSQVRRRVSRTSIPTNQFLWRMNRTRLDAESVRDACCRSAACSTRRWADRRRSSSCRSPASM